jgi:hypothetical protein
MLAPSRFAPLSRSATANICSVTGSPNLSHLRKNHGRIKQPPRARNPRILDQTQRLHSMLLS